MHSCTAFCLRFLPPLSASLVHFILLLGAFLSSQSDPCLPLWFSSRMHRAAFRELFRSRPILRVIMFYLFFIFKIQDHFLQKAIRTVETMIRCSAETSSESVYASSLINFKLLTSRRTRFQMIKIRFLICLETIFKKNFSVCICWSLSLVESVTHNSTSRYFAILTSWGENLATT